VSALAVLIVILLVIIKDEFIQGFWVGTDKFLEKAGLSEANLLIKGKRGYLFMVDNVGDIIHNGKVKITKCLRQIYTIHSNPKIIGRIKINYNTGEMKLYRGKKIYLHLVKDNMATIASNAQ
jgi:hypothetical protein